MVPTDPAFVVSGAHPSSWFSIGLSIHYPVLPFGTDITYWLKIHPPKHLHRSVLHRGLDYFWAERRAVPPGTLRVWFCVPESQNTQLPEENGICAAGKVLCIISMDTLVTSLALIGSSRENLKKKEKEQVGEDIWILKGYFIVLICVLWLYSTLFPTC